MWFLTVDPLIRTSVFIAKLSERYCCWRVIEDFHSQESNQFFDIHCGPFMRLHFSTGCCDCRKTTRLRQGPFQQNSSPFCWSYAFDAPEATNSLSSGLRFDASTYFPKVRKMLLYFSPLIFMNTFGPTSTLLRGQLALATLSPPEAAPQILERWGYADEVHLGKQVRAKDFGLECMRVVQQLSWILHVGSVSACLSSWIKSMKTLAAPYPGLRNHLSCIWWVAHRGSPRSVVWFMLLQHGHCTFVTIVLEPFSRMFINLILKICNHSWSFRTSVLEDATFQRMKWCKFLGGKPCRSIETFYHWDSCLWDFRFSMHFTLSVAWKNSVTDSGVSFFCRFIDIVTETAIVSFRTLPVGFPLPSVSKFSVHTVLSMILDHGVFHIFRFCPQNSCFVNLARYFWIPLSSICDNQDLFSSDESPYCTFPIRS